ncbi:hypothetical protein [Agaribacterium haliotis]|uniref:hypothetical protein n=1 Tax=Agaribacterium haliotis TaxID=2013869 RepID=UPI001EFD3430|nr:hypothetical protein [Agaribacterium haliotis]
MADIHAAHQSGLEHLTFDDHQHPEGELLTDSIAQHESGEHDCHHCCHCQGHSSPALALAFDRIYLNKIPSPVPDYSDNAITDIIETFLRPPKA